MFYFDNFFSRWLNYDPGKGATDRKGFWSDDGSRVEKYMLSSGALRGGQVV